MLNGKQGFDGVDQYMQSGALGGLMGVASAAISSGLWRVDVARAFIAKCIAGGYSMMFE